MLQTFSMSTGPRMHTDFIQGNQSKVEQKPPQCALFYLFQEVSKLASPVHSSFPESNLPPEWPSETSSKDSLAINKEEGPQSFQTSISSTQDILEIKKEEDSYLLQTCHNTLSHLLPCNELKKVSEECQSSKVAASPWKVLSLINLQCEKLLHQENPEGLDTRSASSATKLAYSVSKSSTAAPDVINTGVKSGQCMLGPTPSVSVVQDVTESSPGDNFKLQCCVKDSKVGARLQTAEETDSVRAELLEDSTTASLDLQHRNKIQVNFSANKPIGCSQGCKKACSSRKQDILDAPLTDNYLSQADNAYLNAKLPCNSNETCAALPKPALTLDHNANLTLSVEVQCDNELLPLSPIQPSSQSPSLLFSTAESSLSLSKQDDRKDAPIEEGAPPDAQINSCASKAELWTVQNEEIGSSSSQQWRTKTRRKQPHPSRSAVIQDPDFQGVIFRMDTELDESREQCRLLITAKYRYTHYRYTQWIAKSWYQFELNLHTLFFCISTHNSKELCKSARKPRLRARSSLKASSSDEENGHTNNVLSELCLSVCTVKIKLKV